MRRPALARTYIFVATSSVLMAANPPVRAQSLPSLDARSWRPSSDADASLVLEPATTSGPWRWNVAAWTAYADDPVVFPISAARAARERDAVEQSVSLDLAAGLGLGDRVAVGIDVPLFLWQRGESPIPATGIGKVSILAKTTVVSNDRQGVRSGLGVAALSSFLIPVGDRTGFMSDSAAAGSLQALVEYAFGVGAVRAAAGYAVRGSRTSWQTGAESITFGNTIPWAMGAVIRPKAFAPFLDSDDRQLWEIALHGSLPGGPVAPFGANGAGSSLLSPALLAFDDRVAVGHYRETFVLFGADVGLDDAIGVPTVRAILAVAWSPRSHDRDGDGVPDEADECPDLPEDRDGIQDMDGCPEDDADGDGILDQDDACPLVPGVPSTDPKKNGCPAAAGTGAEVSPEDQAQ